MDEFGVMASTWGVLDDETEIRAIFQAIDAVDSSIRRAGKGPEVIKAWLLERAAMSRRGYQFRLPYDRLWGQR